MNLQSARNRVRRWFSGGPRRPYRRLQLEPLEDRVLLSGGLPPALVVGRTLSAYFTGDVQNNQETVTYTVYNEQANPLTGVLLTDTLKPGVTYQSASQLPDRNGQQLAWSLGTIQGFDRASVSLTISLDNPLPLQIDSGAQAFAALDAKAVSNITPAAVLRQGSVDPALLASTPDANTTDPFIQEEAAKLHYDPQQVFDFLHNEIGYNSYVGSLRGARGTLWSSAGNSLDVAGLGVALMRASGIPSRYVQGTLSEALSQQLIASMFPPPLRVTGFLNPLDPVSDPINDPKLLAETQQHFWFQFDTGAGFVDADPLIPGANINQALATTTDTFVGVPDALRYKLRVRLDRELTSPASNLLTGVGGSDIATVLDDTFTTAELVGKPLTLGFFIQSITTPAVPFTTTNTVYSPYLVLAGDSQDVSQDTLLRGQDFSETLTNFPLGSQVLTGLFATLDTIAPDGTIQTFRKTIADRLGPAIRASGGKLPLDVSPGSVPLVTPFDFTTFNIVTSNQDVRSVLVDNQGVASQTTQYTQLVTAALNTPQGPDRDAMISLAMQQLQRILVAASRSHVLQYEALSDFWTQKLTGTALVKAYLDSPQIHTIQTLAAISPDGADSLKFEIDLLKNNLRAIAFPGQIPSAAIGLQIMRGLSDTILEGQALGDSQSTTNGTTEIGVRRIFDLAQQQGISTSIIAPSMRSQLDELALPANIKALIQQALDHGKYVFAPSKMVSVSGTDRFAWYELNVATGETIGVLDDGSHGFSDWAAAEVSQPGTNPIVKFALGFVVGTGAIENGFAVFRTLVFTELAQLDTLGILDDNTHLFLQYKNAVSTVLASFNSVVFPIIDGLIKDAAALHEAYFAGVAAGIAFGYFWLNDPPVDGFLFAPPTPLPDFANLNAADRPFAIAIVPDTYFYIRSHGAEVRTVFRLGIKNQSSSAETYRIAVGNVPSGFEGETSVQTIYVPAGATGEVGIALRPIGAIGEPGSDATFTVTVTPASDLSKAQSQLVPFKIPETHGILFSAIATAVSALPGSTVGIDLNVTSTGNIAQNVNLAIDSSAGLTVSGLANLVLQPDQTVVEKLELAPGVGVGLNTELTALITGNFGGQLPVTILIPVHVEAPGAASIRDAAIAAGSTGNSDLADGLSDLGIALTNLVQTPASAVYQSQSLASLQSILSLLAVDRNLSSFVAPLSAARDTLAAAQGETQVQAAVMGLGSVLDNFGATVVALQHHGVAISLSPNTQTAPPGKAENFGVVVQNTGNETTTYNLTLLGLPANVTGSLNQISVTLDPGQVSSGIVATLAENSTDALSAFTFQVQATAAGFPQVVQTASGAMQTRPEFVSVASVTPSPPFANPGAAVSVSTLLINSVNRTQDAMISFVVKNAGGQRIFASTPVAATFTVLNSLLNINLGAIDTTGFPLGQYTIDVTVTDSAGNPLPGATGSAALLLGSPVTASLSVGPQLLAPGNSTVTDTLQINSTVNVGDPLTEVAHLPISSFPLFGNPAANEVLEGLALNQAKSYLYIFGDHGLYVINDADPKNPVYVRSTPDSGYTGGIVNGNGLITVGPGPITNIQIFKNSIYNFLDLTTPFGTPDNPGDLQGAFYPYQFAGQPVITGNHLFVPVLQVAYDQQNKVITKQTGTVLSILVDPNQAYRPSVFQLQDELFNSLGTTQQGGGGNGGPNNIFSLAVADPQTLYATTSTATGSDTQNGVGRLLVVDISDPGHINSDSPSATKIVATLDIPGTVQLHGVAIDGNLAFVVGTQGGWRSPFTDISDIGPTGNLVLATVDISDTRHPRLIATQVLPRGARGGGDDLISLGSHRFAFSSLGELSDTPQLLVVDATDPNNVKILKQLDLPGNIRGLKTDGNDLYAVGDDGLTIYQIGGVGKIPVTAQVEIPKGTGVQVVPGSFNVAPTILPGTSFDTLQWNLTLDSTTPNETLSWQTQVSALQPGESRPVALSSILDFTSQGTAGELQVPAVNVFSRQILQLDPASLTVRPGASATYNLTITNPAADPVTYALAVEGVPASWVRLPAQATVPGGGFVTVPVTVTVSPFAQPGSYDFVVEAQVGGTTGSVEGTLILIGDPVLPPADRNAHGVVVELSASHAAIGLGDSVSYTVQLTNTGSAEETFALAASGLPAGVTSSFGQSIVGVPPGANNFRDVQLTLQADGTVLPSDIAFEVTATSLSSGVMGTTQGDLTVLPQGVRVSLDHTTGAPGDTFRLSVTNTGKRRDTFDLSLAGPAALLASLGVNQVTLDPQETRVIQVSTKSVNIAVPGALQWSVIAASETAPPAEAMTTADLVIPTFTGLNAHANPDVRILPVPGSTSFLLLVNNTGNVDDAFTATIIGLHGPIQAHLMGLDGQPTMNIPLFRLPGLSTAAILLQADLQSAGSGMVDVQIRSLSNDGEAVTASVLVSTPIPTPAPPPQSAPPPAVLPAVDLAFALLGASTPQLFLETANAVVHELALPTFLAGETALVGGQGRLLDGAETETVIQGRVFLEDGRGGDSGLAGVRVYLHPAQNVGSPAEVRTAITNERGEFEFRDLPFGSYELGVDLVPGLGQPAQPGKRTVDLGPGKEVVTDVNLGTPSPKPQPPAQHKQPQSRQLNEGARNNLSPEGKSGPEKTESDPSATPAEVNRLPACSELPAAHGGNDQDQPTSRESASVGWSRWLLAGVAMIASSTHWRSRRSRHMELRPKAKRDRLARRN